MRTAVAIVGMACQYPDAGSPAELWANALAGRRAFRRMPSVRMNPDDYLAKDRAAPDSTYVLEAAVIENYEFDRVRFRVAGNTFRSADMAHWLALDVAARALADAGFTDGEGLPKDGTGVLLGNTLTGEFSRANQMRLRWPYVRRVLEQELAEAGWPAEIRAPFLMQMEERYKAPFPPIGEESLAGGLSNTIAGRICNYFDLKGGGYTVDGACASSLLAVSNACSALVAGDLDVALAGGVDLSLDPFELIGFAKTGALAPEKMRIYDARSAGFWPGEGCGFVVLMRQEEAVARGMRVYATIRGWGVSSDGSGGITRPEVAGQILAIGRAYRRAEFGVESVAYFEGHGTGTSVGDSTELQTLSRARREADPDAPPAVIGSVKAIIGHTKAAAGVAGLIKATMALHSQILPPTVGCERPHPVIASEGAALRVLGRGELWPQDLPLRAGVSAMGFGGINAHVVLEGAAEHRKRTFSSYEETLLRSQQDVELFLLGGSGRTEIMEQIARLLESVPLLSCAEMADLADRLHHDLASTTVRAAILASSQAELAERLKLLAGWLDDGIADRTDIGRGVFLGSRVSVPRIGFLFPGQGSPAHLDGGMMRGRFEAVQAIYQKADLPSDGDGVRTDVAQPAIVTAAMAGLRLLDRLGINAEVGLGHSLGELAALHWGGAFDEETLLRIARVRGRAMADLGAPTGAMASIAAPAADVERLMQDKDVVIAGYNSPRQTVISGERAAVAAVVEQARAEGLHATPLPVSHAFHSPLVAAAAKPLADALANGVLLPLNRNVVSTVTGARLEPGADIRDVLYRQITGPVRFIDAIQNAARNIDLFIEVGPGGVLAGLAEGIVDVPALSLDAGGSSLKGLLAAVGACYALGAQVYLRELFADRFVRPIDINRPRRFFENPCEQAPRIASGDNAHVRINGYHNGHHGAPLPLPDAVQVAAEVALGAASAPHPNAVVQGATGAGNEPALEVVRRHVAIRAELPPESVQDGYRLLSDLHLNSITISQLVVDIARELRIQAPVVPTEFANATVQEVAQALEMLCDTAGSMPVVAEQFPAGIDSWVRAFTVNMVELPALPVPSPASDGNWQVIAAPDHPLAEPLRAAIGRTGGAGVVVCLPEHAGPESIELLLNGAEMVGRTGMFVLVQHNGGAPAFARTLHLERPSLAVRVVDLPFTLPDAVGRIVAEARSGAGFAEIYYDEQGIRRSTVWDLLPLGDEPAPLPLTSDDLLLVTGGGKGIAAESALMLARQTGARLLLLGRSNPETDRELAGNLQRMAEAGVVFRYLRADVADAVAVACAIGEGEEQLGGRVTAFLHGAGANVPQLIESLDPAGFQKTLAPKLYGAQHVLAALDPDRLRLVVAFGSIIGRAGLRGEADYAVANDWLSRLVEEWGATHPHCRCLSIEWSVWSGIGMGERLGRVETLLREGIQPISPEFGLAMLRKLLAHPVGTVAVVVAGRFGNPPTARLAERELPFLRFLENIRVHYPGVELVVESKLTSETDPYLADHTFAGQRLFPAVMGLEAFTQVAGALAGSTVASIVFKDVRFERPVIVPEGGATTIRLAALRHDDGSIEVALRSDETGFQVDHFRAICLLNGVVEPGTVAPPVPERLAFEPDAEMYRDILFQRGRFRRVEGYRTLHARHSIAELRTAPPLGWFSQYLPATLLLGDAGVRDAAIHSIQGCIPHRTLLPVGIEAIRFIAPPPAGHLFVHAQERWHEGALYLYDLELRDEHGHLYERWDGLLVRAVERNRHQGPWHPVLLGPYAERRLGELFPGTDVSVTIAQGGDLERPERTDRALHEVLGTVRTIFRRGDGRPEMEGEMNLSAAHAGESTLAVVSSSVIGCDLEPVTARTPELWCDLLGSERFALAEFLAGQSGEGLDTSATRVWAAAESLKKSGAMLTTPLVLRSSEPDGWMVLGSASLLIGTFVNEGDGSQAGPLVMAVLLGGAERGSAFSGTENSLGNGTAQGAAGLHGSSIGAVAVDVNG